MKDKEHGQLASLTQTRDTLVKLRTALKNKVNNILSARSRTLPKVALSSEKKLDDVLRLSFDEIVRIELRVIVEQIRSLNKSIGELDKTIADAGSKLEGHKSLRSIKGIGKITSAILLSVIGVNDFPDEHRLAATSESFRAFLIPIRSNAPGASTSAEASSVGQRWCNRP